MPEKPAIIVYFDGVCNLCNASVDFLIRHDRDKKLRYASLQSSAGQKMLAENRLDTEKFNSFVLEIDGYVFQKSTAALKVAAQLGGWFSLFRLFYVVPKALRDAVYSWVANNRYRWFGKKESCRLPTPEERALFLE